MKRDSLVQAILKIGFTSILLGYFLVWLPHQSVGLSFIGLEMGEWTKFLPKVQGGQYLPDRILFYLPPITLGLMLTVWTIGWPNESWKTWALRTLAVIISLLAFPPFESIQFDSTGQWMPRLLLVLFVAFSAVLCSQAARLPEHSAELIEWSAFLILGLVGAVLPLWTYLVLRPEIASIFGQNVGIGPGLWINTIGQLTVAGVGGYCLLYASKRTKERSIIA